MDPRLGDDCMDMGDGPKVNVYNFYGPVHGDINGFNLDDDCPDA